MKEFCEIGKKLPYNESNDYVMGLVGKCADMAVVSAPAIKKHGLVKRIYFIATGVAAAALLAFMSINYVNKVNAYEQINKSQTLPQVLSTMSDEEVMDVSYYTVDDIPEY